MGSLQMLNEMGDTTISWTEDRDAEMEAVIKKKMAEGVTFFIVKRGRGSQALTERGPQLKKASDASKHHALVIPDEDLAKFVSSGAGAVTKSSDGAIEDSKVSSDAAEVAKSDAVGIKQRRGG